MNSKKTLGFRRSTHSTSGLHRMVLALLLSAVMTLTACAGTGDDGTGGAAGPVDQQGLDEAKAIVDEYRQPPSWQGPDEPVDVSGLEGKRVVYISVSNSIPVLKYWSEAVADIADEYGGVSVEIVDAKGSVDEANKGFQQAIASQADAIVLLALPSELFTSKIAEAQAAGIKVVTAQTGVPGKTEVGQDAEVTFDYTLVGELIGAWMVADSDGEGKGLLITSDDVPASQSQAQGTLSEVKRLCPACDMQVKDVQIPQWETSIPTLFQSTLNSDPARTYFFPLYDGQALPGLGALRTAGAGERVTVGAFNATPGIVEQIKDPKSGLKLEVGGQNEWWAYAATDAIFRVLSGAEPIEDYKVGLRIFDSTNADLIVGDDEFAWYETTEYRTRFPELWAK